MFDFISLISVITTTCYCGHVYFKLQDPSVATKMLAFLAWIGSVIFSLLGFK